MAGETDIPKRGGVLSGPWDGHVQWAPISSLAPPHEPDEPENLERISRSMAIRGWEGRPLLVADYGDHLPWQCQTGSHRYASAQRVGLRELPIVLVDVRDAEPEDAAMDQFEFLCKFAAPELVAAIKDLMDADDYPTT